MLFVPESLWLATVLCTLPGHDSHIPQHPTLYACTFCLPFPVYCVGVLWICAASLLHFNRSIVRLVLDALQVNSQGNYLLTRQSAR